MHWQKVVPGGWAVWQHNDKGGSLGNSVSWVCTSCIFPYWGNVRDAGSDKPALHLSSHLHGILGCGLHWMIMEMAFHWWDGKLCFPYIHRCPLILVSSMTLPCLHALSMLILLVCSRELQLEGRAVPHYADQVAMGFMPVKQFLACLVYRFTSEGIHAS